MKSQIKIGLLAVIASGASWIACTPGSSIGPAVTGTGGTGGTTAGAAGTGEAGTTGAAGDSGPGAAGDTGTAGTGDAGTTGTGGAGLVGGSSGGDPAGVGGVGAAGTTGTGGRGGTTGAAGTTGPAGRGGGAGTAAGGAGGGTGGTAGTGPIQILVWNHAVTYGHQARMTAIPLFMARAAANNMNFDLTYAHTATLPEGQTDSTSNPSVFTDAGLDKYDVIFFLNTTGNTMDGDGQATTHRNALINFMKKGRGFVGVHAATDTYLGTAWPWYVDFMGANFRAHSPQNTQGTARFYQNMTHPILTAAAVANPWNRAEEWYLFTRDPLASAIAGIKILQTCTDTVNTAERAITWVHEMPMEAGAPRQGRMFYTAFGHFLAAFQEPKVMDLIIAGIKWTAYRI
jgi:uncharacterized protein